MNEETQTPAQSESALVPVQQQVVDFYGDPIPVAQAAEGELYVPLRPLTDFLGLADAPQRRRVLRDPVLAARARAVQMTGSDGRKRIFLCLPLDLLPGWLFGIDTSRVRPELTEKLTRYRAECFRVLWNAFKAEILPSPPLASTLSGAELAVEIAGAVYALAQQQLALERQLADEAAVRAALAGRHQALADYTRGFIQETRAAHAQTELVLADTRQRLSALELRLDPKSVITEAQAAELALAVKNVGQRLAAQGDRQGYAKVYSELYRRYQVSSYKNLPQSKLAEVLAWLAAWYQELGGEGRGAGPA